MEKIIGRTLLALEYGDLTKYAVDAIVNAANSHLQGGGGVDGAIQRAGGPSILRECQAIISRIHKLPAGKAVITGAGKLPARHVIHTVGPVWSGGQGKEAAILASAYRESLALADQMACRTLAFPSISTGAYGYPVAQAAQVAISTIAQYLSGPTGLQKVILVLFSQDDLKIYSAVLQAAQPLT